MLLKLASRLSSRPARTQRSSRLVVALMMVALACYLRPAPSAAQTALPLPPEKFEMTPGGVDIRTGRYVYDHADLVIGDQSNGLTLKRSFPTFVPSHATNPMANFTHNWDVSIEIRNVDLNGTLAGGNLPSGNDFEAFVNYGGHTQTFTSPYAAAGYATQSKTAYFTLTFTGGRNTASSVYYFRDSSNDTIQFQSLGTVNGLAITGLYPVQIAKSDGTTYTYAYTAYADGTGNHPLLQSVTSSFGYSLLFEYSSGLVSKACALNLAQAPLPANKLCPTGVQTVNYAYTGSRLTSVTDASSNVWGFQYTSSGGFDTSMSFIKPGQATPWLVNTLAVANDELDGAYYIVTDQSFVDGQAYHYQYEHPPLMNGRVPVKMGGYFTDALGQKTSASYGFYALPRPPCGVPPCTLPKPGTTVYQITPGPITVTDPLGKVTTYDYCDPTYTTSFCDVGKLQSVTSPEGIKSSPTYDTYMNIWSLQRTAKPGSALASTTQSATYDCMANLAACNKPLTTTDAKGNVSTYTYDPTHGGILIATSPAVVPNGAGSAVAPVKRYAYVQRYAWVSNGAGGYVHGGAQMWLLASEKTCRSTATNLSTDSCAGGANDEVVTAYDYGPDSGPNNLLLRGTTVTAVTPNAAGTLVSTTLRSCYGYDAQGNKISETKPRANLSVCP
jgi:hypothetical protein